ncbi:MAG TPA: T9SS type A sorting domain-containing protein, partial [Candidatus Marinimicrobia bacterium]|nr:T9SS type A sorting domain-containing protein [Candidatus Neomarinimicrobiota bacterium]
SDLNVQINIYNIIGQQVASIDQGLLNPGSYTVTWNGKDTFGNFVPSGVYFYEIKAGEQFQKIKKMTLLK